MKVNLNKVFYFRVSTVEHIDRAIYKEKIHNDPSFKVAFAEEYTISVYDNQMSPKDQRNKICKEIFLTIPIVVYTRRDFFLLSAMNKKIEDFKTAGLINFWISEDLNMEIMKKIDPTYPRVLTLAQLIGGFQLLLFGCLISFVVFIVEILVHI